MENLSKTNARDRLWVIVINQYEVVTIRKNVENIIAVTFLLVIALMGKYNHPPFLFYISGYFLYLIFQAILFHADKVVSKKCKTQFKALQYLLNNLGTISLTFSAIWIGGYYSIVNGQDSYDLCRLLVVLLLVNIGLALVSWPFVLRDQINGKRKVTNMIPVFCFTVELIVIVALFQPYILSLQPLRQLIFFTAYFVTTILSMLMIWELIKVLFLNFGKWPNCSAVTTSSRT